MIVFVNKRTDPLFLEFRVTNLECDQNVLLLWEDTVNNACIYSEHVTIKNNYIYFSEINKSLSFFKNDISFKIIDSNFNILYEYVFKKLIFEEKSKILYISQYSNTGYGYAARNYVYQLVTNEFDVHWKVDDFGSNFTPTTDEEKLVDSKITSKIDEEYDYIIIHHVPDIWGGIIEKLKKITKYKKIYGLTTWETTTLNKKWINLINNSGINELIVHSDFNVEVFKNSKIIKPINRWYIDIFPKLNSNELIKNKIYSKCLLYQDGNYFDDSATIEEIFDQKTVYYNISQYNERKNLDQLVRTFCKKFNSTDNVCLFIKTFFKEFTASQTEYLKYRFHTLLKHFKNPPKIVFCFDDLNDKEIQFIHHISDVYFTLNRGEGFGLCTFTAKKFDNKIICGKFGAEKEFIDNNDVLLDYQLVPTFNMYHYHNWYDDDNQQWASYEDDYILSKLQYYPKK